MSLEKNVVDTLAAACAVPAWFGAQPQAEDEAPSEMPVVIVNRPDADFLNDFAGADIDLALTTIQVDYYAETAEAARRLADAGRIAVRAIADAEANPICPVLATESSFYDQISRGWRVMQQWRMPDYSPALPPVTA